MSFSRPPQPSLYHQRQRRSLVPRSGRRFIPASNGDRVPPVSTRKLLATAHILSPSIFRAVLGLARRFLPHFPPPNPPNLGLQDWGLQGRLPSYIRSMLLGNQTMLLSIRLCKLSTHIGDPAYLQSVFYSLDVPILYQPDAGFQSLDALSGDQDSWLEMPLRSDRPMPFRCAVSLYMSSLIS